MCPDSPRMILERNKCSFFIQAKSLVFNLIARSHVMAQEANKRATKLDFIPVILPLLSDVDPRDVDILDEELESLSSSGNVFSLFQYQLLEGRKLEYKTILNLQCVVIMETSL